MELVFVARALWRNKLLVALGVVLSMAVFMKAPKPHGAGDIAWTRVVLDTPKSQLVSAGPFAAESLPWRAQMLTDLLMTEEFKRQIARHMGIPRQLVGVVNPTLVTAPVPASVPQAAAGTDLLIYAPFILVPSMPDASVPIVDLEALAPNAEAARRLVTAAVAVLRAQSPRPGNYASLVHSGANEHAYEPFDVEQMDPVRWHAAPAGKGPALAIGLAVGFLLAWCIGIVVIVAPLRRARNRRHVPQLA